MFSKRLFVYLTLWKDADPRIAGVDARNGWRDFIRSWFLWLFAATCLKGIAQTGMDAQAMLGFFKVR